MQHLISIAEKQALCYSWHNTYSGNIVGNVYWIIIIKLIKMFKSQALPVQALRVPEV
jgi:hypothetical protein